jgi:cytoskeletal protein CcmA (bactofilin family)
MRGNYSHNQFGLAAHQVLILRPTPGRQNDPQTIVSISITASMNPGSTIIRDVRITGTLEFSDTLFLDCHFKGEILSDGELIVGEHASVEGEIKTKKLDVYGKVRGNVVVEETCRLKKTSQMIGDIKSSKLEMDEGSTFHGFASVPFKKATEVDLPNLGEETATQPSGVHPEKSSEVINFPTPSENQLLRLSDEALSLPTGGAKAAASKP